MKNLFQILLAVTFLSYFSFSTRANYSPIQNPSTSEAITGNGVSIQSTLISLKPCKQGGYQVRLRVDVIVEYDGAFLMVASQEVNIPCGTVHGSVTRPQFDKYANAKNIGSVALITDYLNENDSDGSTFKLIVNDMSNKIQKAAIHLEKKE